MHFKRLELIGFKSFSEKTVIEFQAGVTAIVGPNGCGKSNISDAIRWVLGEQSVKSLRGSSMEDVIFNGSALKEPLNLAEVSLTLSNETRALAIDYDEVTITRRLYRSGDSEYLINKNTVRLKDIHEMLMGTGIGTESYSIIEQGKMDLILNAKPEDRRTIFEEAAGITKFKSKKKEALRKIEQTDQNLLRVGDIIEEVRRQISSIERQAKKAENYKIEFEKLKSLELSVASKEFLSFDQKKRDRDGELESLKSAESEITVLTDSIEQILDEKTQALDSANQSLQEAQSKEVNASAEIRRNQDRVLLDRERIGELTERRENLLKQIELSKRRAEEFGAEYENLNREFETIQREEAEGLSFLSSVEAEFASMDQFAQSSSSEAESARFKLLDIANKKAHHQSELAKIHAESHGLEMRLKRLKEEEESVLKEIRETEESFGVSSSEASAVERRIAGPMLRSKIKEFKDKILSIFRLMTAKPDAGSASPEETELDSEIHRFAEEVMSAQGQLTAEQSRMQFFGETRKKLEERLALISGEARGLLNEEEALKNRQAGEEVGSVSIQEEEKALNESLERIDSSFKEKAGQREALIVRLTETRSKQGHCTAKREKIEKDKTWILESKINEELQLLRFEKEAEEANTKKEGLESEDASLEEDLSRLSISRDEILKQTEKLRSSREEVVLEINELNRSKGEKFKILEEAKNKVHAYELQNAELRYEMDRIKERIYNTYQVDILVQVEIANTNAAAAEALEGGAELNIEEAKASIQTLKDKLSKMGPVNLVAIQEYDEMKERYDFLTKQQQDLNQAKDDLHKAILKINRTTKEMFVETFASIQKYFSEYYKLLFAGGSAELVLLDENDVLESGIEIIARPPGKKLQNITLLSGGEKALTAVALMFSLFKVKPSPFCVLDEIDAPLDESNVDRFCTVLKDFVTGSQFIVITHNKRTMNLADAMYGITMAETGISRVVSVRFAEKVHLNGNGTGKDKKEVLV